MKNEPILVLLAAGMGSRYGGLKQIDPVGPNGEILMDYSLYDAREAGFKRVIFIIKKQDEEAFDEAIGNRIKKYFEVRYAYQDLDDLPEGYENPEGREKPWGTSHAVLAARDLIDAPFCVLNADDYYGREAFEMIYKVLTEYEEKDTPEYTMIAYQLMKTLSDHGHVARGVCKVDDDGYLKEIVERTKIIKTEDGASFSEDDGETWEPLDPDSIVSMNFWGFGPSLIDFLKEGFPPFLDKALRENPMKAEYLLPTSVGNLMEAGKVVVKTMACPEKWYGVTYKQDKPVVVEAIQKMIDAGKYPSPLWE